MMVKHTLVERFLEAEQRLSERHVERALTALFAALPYRTPAVGLVDRVLFRLSVVPAPAAGPGLLYWSTRVGLAACLMMVAGSLLWLPILLRSASSPIGHLVSVAVGSVELSASWLSAALSLWHFFSDIGEKVSLVLATPEATVGLAMAVFLQLAAFRWLYTLTLPHRSELYVDSV